MKEVLYSERPSVFQTYENGEVQYRWDTEEVISDNTSQWRCKEVTINSPIDKDKLTQAVITSMWDNDKEKKLINDYNGAKAGLFNTATKAKYIANYTTFLNERKAIKEQIDIDWNNRNN
ncbi:MAG: hypothetical protein PHD45_07875 [Bacteroidales bacterium]|nr:hypothetical protein [Bacteroidales bacterium]